MNTVCYRPPAGTLRRLLAVALGLVAQPAMLPAKDPAPRGPDRQEQWVPTKDWEAVLAKHPSAVMLTPEQYEALVRDAGKIKPPKPDEKLPAQAIVENARFTANATDESAELLKLHGELTLRCLTDDWAEVTARLPFRNLASATVDGSTVLGLPETVQPETGAASQRKLLVRGKGEHRITVEILARPGSTSLANTRSLAFFSIDVPAVLDLQLPPHAEVTSANASYSRDGDLAHVLLHSPGKPELRSLAWTTSAAITQAARQTTATGLTSITDHSIETTWQLAIERSTTDTAATIAFDVMPADAVVLSLEGDGVTHWEQTGARVTATLRDRTHALALTARVQTVIDLQSATTAQPLVLPTLSFVGHLAKDVEARVASIAEGVTLMEYQGAIPEADGTLHWNPVRDTVKLLLRKADPRVVVDADAHVTVTHDDVLIDRTLMVQTDRPVTELRITLPAGEEFLSTTAQKGPAIDWKRVGSTLEYRWATALNANQPASLQLATRKRLPAATAASPAQSLTLESLTIADARKQAGYIALDFDPTWRVSIKTARGLEDRDARRTPVKGQMAWFGLRSFQLAFEVQRREPVFDTDLTAYALPRAKTVEIEGQLTLTITDAPLRQFKVTLDKANAALARFTSPLIGEQQLDPATGTWSLTLRKESLGRVPLRFRLSQPSTAATPGTANSEAETITAQLPIITVPAARRQHGIWVIEANTDTELALDAKSMQPLDVLRVPAIEDYQPRHRIVAAYDYATAGATLTLHASRHGHSELAALLIHELRLITVFSADGSARHQAIYDVQHSGEQFLNVQLPASAQLLTVLAAGQPVKPVRGPNGTISVPLPADSANQPSVPVRLLYETTDTTWTSSGQRQLQPPSIPGTTPVLATDWQVYVPNGYGFRKVDTELAQEGTGIGRAPSFKIETASEPVDFLSGGGAPVLSPEHRSDRTQLEKPRTEYHYSDRDHERAKLLSNVSEAWEDKPANDSTTFEFEKLKAIRLPIVQLKETSIEQAIEFLRSKSREFDQVEANPARKGVNIILNSGDSPNTAKITLDLKDVPLEEALRYVSELAGMKYKIEANAVVVVPVTESTTEQYTRVYKVPPDFLSLAARSSEGAAAAADPFAPADKSESSATVKRRLGAKELLGATGIPFPDGSAAVFNPATSQLIIKNTEPNLDLMETLLASMKAENSKGDKKASLKSGLLPLELELPTAGYMLRFHGPQAPTALTLRYISAGRQIMNALLMMLLGAALYYFWGRRSKGFPTLLIIVIDRLGISLINPDYQPLADAFMVGWLLALGIILLLSMFKAFEAGLREGAKASAVPVTGVTTLLVMGLLLTTSLHAAEPPMPDPASHSVLIPFDESKPITGQKPQRYYLDRADFDRLWALAKENRKPEVVVDADDAKPSAVVQSALYRAVIEDERFTVEAQFDVTSRGPWAKQKLSIQDGPGGSALPLRGLIIDGKPGAMAGDEVAFEKPGRHVVQISYEVAQRRGWQNAKLSLPAARAAMASIQLGAGDAMPRFADSKLVAVEENQNGKRVVTVGLGAAEVLEFDRVQRRPVNDAIPPSAEVTVTTSLTGEMRLHGVAKVRYAFPGSARQEASLFIDPDWSLDATPTVTCGANAVREVRINLAADAGRQRLSASFPHEVSDEVTLELHLTPKVLKIEHSPLIVPAAAKWETITRLIAQDGVQLNAKPTPTQQRLENEDYSYKTNAKAVSIPVVRYRIGSNETLAFETKPADAKTAARVEYVYQLSEQKQELAAAITLTRERGTWRQLRLTLPAGMEIQGVQSPQLSAWEQQGSDLFLRFQETTGSEARVVVYVANAVLQPTKTWTLSPLVLHDIEKISGNAIVAAHAATEARLDGFQRDHDLREIDPATLNATFIITAPLEKKRAIEFERAEWKLSVALQDLPTRFSADGVVMAQATDLGVLLSQQVLLIVEQGALKRVLIRLPKALPEATVTGEQLREVQSHIVGDQREYECSFQSQGGLLGSTALTFDMQLPLTNEALAIPFVAITDAERLRRFFVLDNSSSRESKLLLSDGVDACAKDALPYLPNVLTQPQFYQGRPSGGLQVAFTQLQATSGNSAVVTLADITTVIRSDGERWDTVVYSISNRSLQFLPVILPENAELIAVDVSGEPVRADEETRIGKRVRLIPLIQTRPGERSMEVKLVYRLRGNGVTKQVRFTDPELVGISAERTVWTASLPPGWTLADSNRDTFGNMEPIAEEGRDIEKVQSWISDLSRINRVVSSSKDYEGNQAALAEAEKLNQQIASVTQKVESKRNGRYFNKGEGVAEAKLQQQTLGDLSKVKEEMTKQTIVLSENRIQQPKLGKQLINKSGVLMNGWSTNTYQGKSTVSKPTEPAAQQGAALNDNIAVGNTFFAGTLVLNGGNTYSGATLISGGAVTLGIGNSSQAITLNNSSNFDTNTSSNGMNAFGFNSNARATAYVDLNEPQVSSNAGSLTLAANGSNDNNSTTSNIVGSNSTAVTAISGNAVDVFGGRRNVTGTGLPPGLQMPNRKMVANSSNASITLPDAPPALIEMPSLKDGKKTVIQQQPVTLNSIAAYPVASRTGGFDKAAEVINEDAAKARQELKMAPAAAADPFAAAPVPTSPAPSPSPHVRYTLPKALADNKPSLVSQSGMIRGTSITPAQSGSGRDQFKNSEEYTDDKDQQAPGYLTTATVNQLRPTGRRSLQVAVPMTGEVWHFRKLKDHAVLDLSLKRESTANKTAQTTALGIGIGIWALLSLIASRRQRKNRTQLN